MILSFHPLFEADQNIICAGRQPDENDLSAIKAADAVILPQGCVQALFEMARDHCRHVFPNYVMRFKFPNKIGQIQLFRKFGAAHPKSAIFANLEDFQRRNGKNAEKLSFHFPCVFKFDWGGEGATVHLIESTKDLQNQLNQAENFEKSGQSGFLLQEYIPNRNKSLRVVIIGRQLISYWRVQANSGNFLANLSKGALIDRASDPDLQLKAIATIENFCKKTGINLAGFDVIFSAQKEPTKPLLLEINYFFGRKGLGGSEAYYSILQKEIRCWLSGIAKPYEKKKENTALCI
jgi:ribosomal protein S6--L-glutamate ligase